MNHADVSQHLHFYLTFPANKATMALSNQPKKEIITMNAQGKWDLSFLYESFDDPRFAADLASLPEDIAALKALVEADGEPKAKLEAIKVAQEALLAKEDRLMGYCALCISFTTRLDQRRDQSMYRRTGTGLCGCIHGWARSQIRKYWLLGG